MNGHCWRRNAPLLLVIVLLGGCGFLKPQRDRSEFFVLTSLDPGSPAATSLVVGLGPIRFPDYLQRAEMVLRTTDHRLEFSAFARWAEPLEGNFQSVLSENLTKRLKGAEILKHPWFASAAPAYDVPIEVLRFEAVSAGAAELHARWSVRDSKTKRVLAAAESRLSQALKGNNPDVAVAALSRVVAQLSEEIATAILKADPVRSE